MKITKKQIRRIIKEELLHENCGGMVPLPALGGTNSLPPQPVEPATPPVPPPAGELEGPDADMETVDLADMSPSDAFGFAWSKAIEQLSGEFPEAAAKLTALSSGGPAPDEQQPLHERKKPKLTRTRLKRIIKEELKNLQERTMAPSGEVRGKTYRGEEEKVGRFQGMLYALEDDFFPFLDGADPDGLRMAEELYRHLQEMIKEYGGSEKTLHEHKNK